MDRDVNAARNIVFLAFQELGQSFQDLTWAVALGVS